MTPQQKPEYLTRRSRYIDEMIRLAQAYHTDLTLYDRSDHTFGYYNQADLKQHLPKGAKPWAMVYSEPIVLPEEAGGGEISYKLLGNIISVE